MKKLLRALNVFDWILGFGFIGAAFWLSDWRYAAAGVIGLLVAYFKPAKRFQAYVESRVVQRRNPTKHNTDQVAQEEAFYEAALNLADATETPAAKRTYADPAVPYRGTFLSRSKHNRMTPESLEQYHPNPKQLYH